MLKRKMALNFLPMKTALYTSIKITDKKEFANEYIDVE